MTHETDVVDRLARLLRDMNDRLDDPTWLRARLRILEAGRRRPADILRFPLPRRQE